VTREAINQPSECAAQEIGVWRAIFPGAKHSGQRLEEIAVAKGGVVIVETRRHASAGIYNREVSKCNPSEVREGWRLRGCRVVGGTRHQAKRLHRNRITQIMMKCAPGACRCEHLAVIQTLRLGRRTEMHPRKTRESLCLYETGPRETLMKCNLRTWLMLNGPCRSLTAEHESNVIGSSK
jgi:hypothetical protein